MSVPNKKVVYIAGPFRSRNNPYGYNFWGQTRHIREAEEVALDVWALGHVALCPHLNTANFQGALPDQLWLEGDLALVRRCDAVLTTPRWRDSSGAQAEVEFAKAHNIPVFHTLDALRREFGELPWQNPPTASQA